MKRRFKEIAGRIFYSPNANAFVYHFYSFLHIRFCFDLFYRNIYSHMYSLFGFAGWSAYALQLCQQIIASCLFFTLTNEPKTIQQILVSLNLRFHELTTIISSWISIPFFWRSVEFRPHFFGGVLNLGIY